jgi:hypothetical protein
MFLKIGLGALSALLMTGVIDATAGEATPSTVVFVDFADSNNDGQSDYIIGKVASPKKKCISGRTVKIFRRPPGGGDFRLVDSDRSSKRGYWAGGGYEEINAQDGKVTIERKVIQRAGGRIVCGADSELFD